MTIQGEIQFLIAQRDKIDLLIGKVSLNEPLVEISANLSARIAELEAEAKTANVG